MAFESVVLEHASSHFANAHARAHFTDFESLTRVLCAMGCVSHLSIAACFFEDFATIHVYTPLTLHQQS